jgi:hypothetical protein
MDGNAASMSALASPMSVLLARTDDRRDISAGSHPISEPLGMDHCNRIACTWALVGARRISVGLVQIASSPRYQSPGGSGFLRGNFGNGFGVVDLVIDDRR